MLDFDTLEAGGTLYAVRFHTTGAKKGTCTLESVSVASVAEKQVRLAHRTWVTGYREFMPRRKHANWAGVSQTAGGAIEAFRDGSADRWVVACDAHKAARNRFDAEFQAVMALTDEVCS